MPRCTGAARKKFGDGTPPAPVWAAGQHTGPRPPSDRTRAKSRPTGQSLPAGDTVRPRSDRTTSLAIGRHGNRRSLRPRSTGPIYMDGSGKISMAQCAVKHLPTGRGEITRLCGNLGERRGRDTEWGAGRRFVHSVAGYGGWTAARPSCGKESWCGRERHRQLCGL